MIKAQRIQKIMRELSCSKEIRACCKTEDQPAKEQSKRIDVACIQKHKKGDAVIGQRTSNGNAGLCRITNIDNVGICM